MYGHAGRMLSDTPQWDVGFLRADNLLRDFAIPPGDAVSLSLSLSLSDGAPVALLMPLSLPISDVCVRWEGGRKARRDLRRWDGRREREQCPSQLSLLSSLISDATVDYAHQFHALPPMSPMWVFYKNAASYTLLFLCFFLHLFTNHIC